MALFYGAQRAGLRRLRALVLTTVSAENPCSQRYVVENGSRKLIASLPINGFSFLTEVQKSRRRG